MFKYQGKMQNNVHIHNCRLKMYLVYCMMSLVAVIQVKGKPNASEEFLFTRKTTNQRVLELDYDAGVRILRISYEAAMRCSRRYSPGVCMEPVNVVWMYLFQVQNCTQRLGCRHTGYKHNRFVSYKQCMRRCNPLSDVYAAVLAEEVQEHKLLEAENETRRRQFDGDDEYYLDVKRFETERHDDEESVHQPGDEPPYPQYDEPAPPDELYDVTPPDVDRFVTEHMRPIWSDDEELTDDSFLSVPDYYFRRRFVVGDRSRGCMRDSDSEGCDSDRYSGPDDDNEKPVSDGESARNETDENDDSINNNSQPINDTRRRTGTNDTTDTVDDDAAETETFYADDETNDDLPMNDTISRFRYSDWVARDFEKYVKDDVFPYNDDEVTTEEMYVREYDMPGSYDEVPRNGTDVSSGSGDKAMDRDKDTSSESF